jgi:hypothetical protein
MQKYNRGNHKTEVSYIENFKVKQFKLTFRTILHVLYHG